MIQNPRARQLLKHEQPPYSSDITTPAPTVIPSLRKMIRPVLRFTWKGSTGIPRLLVSCIRTMAAPPSGMCLNYL
jgi:hypothetical protein